jgi:hypothetical protein
MVVDFGVLIFSAWWSGVFAGVFAKTVCWSVVFDGEVVVDGW